MQKRLLVSLLGCCTLLMVLVILWSPVNLSFACNYVVQIYRMIEIDEERASNQVQIFAQNEWTIHKLYMSYFKKECTDTRKNYAWMTALQNDKFILPTIVLGYLLNKLSCLENKVVLVSDKVSTLGRKTLTAVGFQVQEVPGLDCNYMDRYYGREEANKGITGTHIRLLAFNLTTFDKVIYLDGDYFPITPLDGLFEEVWPGRITAAYCSKPGVVDPCFNAGLIGVVPNSDLFAQVMNYWRELSAFSCPDDQRLLWYFFAHSDNWIPISYSYNVRRERYYPMRSFHFAGHGLEPRPWEWVDRPGPAYLKKLDSPLYTVMDMVALWWKYLYLAIDEYELQEFWQYIQIEL